MSWTTLRRQPLLFALLCGLQALCQLAERRPWSLLILLVTPALMLAAMVAMARFTAGQQPHPALPPASRRDRKLLRALLALGKMLVIATVCLNVLCAVSASLGAMDPPDNALRPLWHVLLALWWLLLSLAPATLMWHAPGLVYWHGQPAWKAVVLSGKAWLRNWRAGLLLGLAWSGLALVFIIIAMVLKACAPSYDGLQAALVMPLSMLMLSNFCCFRDCFSPPPAQPACAGPDIA